MIRLTILPLLPEPLSASGRAFLQASASLCSHSSESFIRFPSLFCQISLPFRQQGERKKTASNAHGLHYVHLYIAFLSERR